MPGVSSLLAILAILAVVFVVLLIVERRRRALARCRAMAVAIGGTAVNSNLISYQRRGANCLFSNWKHLRPCRATTWGKIGFAGDVQAVMRGFSDPPYTHDGRVEIEAPEGWRITTKVPAEAAAFEKKGFGEFLIELARWAPGPARVVLEPADAMIQIEREIRIAENLVGMADRLERLLDLCASREGTGIRIVEAKLEEAGTCQICGTPIAGEVVRCRKCNTPHHKDCWDYLGRCSTFGCKGV